MSRGKRGRTDCPWTGVSILVDDLQNPRVKCIFCTKEFSGGVQRVKGHFHKCTPLLDKKDAHNLFMEEFRAMEEKLQNEKKKKKADSALLKGPMDAFTTLRCPGSGDVDKAIADFFYE
eukprot:Sspe_Gene.113212::Locus_97168_Transcript_1_1_Confidence_1.000_Length_395::g.113212::m.113212